MQQIFPIGGLEVQLTLCDGRLRSVTFSEVVPESFNAEALSAVLGHLATFSLDFDDAPPFFRKVWERMREIPLGSAVTYRELAEEAGSPRAVRAVGQACATNPLPLIVPCHRVLAESGLGGFRLGQGWKRKLLELETELVLRS